MNKYVLASYRPVGASDEYADIIINDEAHIFIDLVPCSGDIEQIQQLHDGLLHGEAHGVLILHLGAIADLDEALRDGCGMVERASVASHICIDLMQMIEDGYSKPQLMTTIEEIISTLIGENGLAELKGGEV